MKLIVITIMSLTLSSSIFAESLDLNVSVKSAKLNQTYNLVKETDDTLVYKVKKRKMTGELTITNQDGERDKEKINESRVPGKKRWDKGYNILTIKKTSQEDTVSININSKECSRYKRKVLCIDQNLDLEAYFNKGSWSDLKNGEEVVELEYTEDSMKTLYEAGEELMKRQFSEQVTQGLKGSLAFKALLILMGSSVDELSVSSRVNNFYQDIFSISGSKKSLKTQDILDLDMNVYIYF